MDNTKPNAVEQFNDAAELVEVTRDELLYATRAMKDTRYLLELADELSPDVARELEDVRNAVFDQAVEAARAHAGALRVLRAAEADGDTTGDG